jgi:hypothetical protein
VPLPLAESLSPVPAPLPAGFGRHRLGVQAGGTGLRMAARPDSHPLVEHGVQPLVGPVLLPAVEVVAGRAPVREFAGQQPPLATGPFQVEQAVDHPAQADRARSAAPRGRFGGAAAAPAAPFGRRSRRSGRSDQPAGPPCRSARKLRATRFNPSLETTLFNSCSRSDTRRQVGCSVVISRVSARVLPRVGRRGTRAPRVPPLRRHPRRMQLA